MIEILPNVDTSELDAALLDERGYLKIVPSSIYLQFDPVYTRLWCHKHGFYCLPTTELIEWLRQNIVPHKTIEIGAGNGAVGRALGIPITDSCFMEKPEVAEHYKLMGQPVTTYAPDIIKADALAAISGFKPSVVIACWVTHKYLPTEAWREGNKWGIEERIILNKVKKYILVGNTTVHDKKPIMDIEHEELYFPWLLSRLQNQENNRIYIWHKH
jgi:hypothetical protein